MKERGRRREGRDWVFHWDSGDKGRERFCTATDTWTTEKPSATSTEGIGGARARGRREWEKWVSTHLCRTVQNAHGLSQYLVLPLSLSEGRLRETGGKGIFVKQGIIFYGS